MAANQVSVEGMLANMRPKAKACEPAKALAMPEMSFDPIERAAWAEGQVMKGTARRYYRFRHARFYGGIISADAVGCQFLCHWEKGGRCWNFSRNQNPATGDFFSPDPLAAKLVVLAEKNACWKFRVSGCEPFLGFLSTAHLYEVISLVRNKYRASQFVVESNGAMLGFMPSLLDDFPKGARLRICLKGQNEAQSEQVTNARGAHALQMRAIEEAAKKGIRLTVAAMAGYVDLSKIELPLNAGREMEKLSRGRA